MERRDQNTEECVAERARSVKQERPQGTAEGAWGVTRPLDGVGAPHAATQAAERLAETAEQLAHPSAPSICIRTRRLNSKAYSIGSSLVKTSKKPWTTRFWASFSVIPRLIR